MANNNYQDQFGKINFIKGEECSSVLSASAYLLELMKLKDEFVDETDITVNQLFTRRPDLQQVLLDCQNTNTLTPYVTVINNVLNQQVERIENIPKVDGKIDIAAINQKLSEAKYPFNLPFSLPLHRVHAYLEQLKIDPLALYKLYATSEDAAAIVQTVLRLSTKAYSAISSEQTTESDLAPFFGESTGTGLINTLKEVQTFTQKTGLSYDELRELLRQNLSQAEQSANQARHFFINSKSTADDYYLISRRGVLKKTADNGGALSDLSSNDVSYFDRINRVVRLAKRLDWSFTDLDWVLQSCCNKTLDANALKIISIIKKLKDRYKQPIDVICGLCADVKNVGQGADFVSNAPGILSETLFDRIFNNPFMEQDAYEALPDGSKTLEAINDRLLGALKIDQVGLDLIYTSLAIDKNVHQATHDNLSSLYRFSKLSQLLNLTVQEYFDLLTLLSGENETHLSSSLPILFALSGTNASADKVMTILKGNDTTANKTLERLQWIDVLSEVKLFLRQKRLSVAELKFMQTGVPSYQHGRALSVLGELVLKGLYEAISGEPDGKENRIYVHLANSFSLRLDIVEKLTYLTLQLLNNSDVVDFFFSSVNGSKDNLLSIFRSDTEALSSKVLSLLTVLGLEAADLTALYANLSITDSNVATEANLSLLFFASQYFLARKNDLLSLESDTIPLRDKAADLLSKLGLDQTELDAIYADLAGVSENSKATKANLLTLLRYGQTLCKKKETKLSELVSEDLLSSKQSDLLTVLGLEAADLIALYENLSITDSDAATEANLSLLFFASQYFLERKKDLLSLKSDTIPLKDKAADLLGELGLDQTELNAIYTGLTSISENSKATEANLLALLRYGQTLSKKEKTQLSGLVVEDLLSSKQSNLLTVLGLEAADLTALYENLSITDSNDATEANLSLLFFASQYFLARKNDLLSLESNTIPLKDQEADLLSKLGLDETELDAIYTGLTSVSENSKATEANLLALLRYGQTLSKKNVSALKSKENSFLQGLQQWTHISKRIRLNNIEIQTINQNIDYFELSPSTNSPLKLSLVNLKRLYQFNEFSNQYSNSIHPIDKYFGRDLEDLKKASDNNVENLTWPKLLEMTDWQSDNDLKALVRGHNSFSALWKVHDKNQLAQSLNLSLSKVNEDVWDKIWGSSANLSKASNNLHSIISGNLDEKTIKSLAVQMEVKRRDELVPYVMHLLFNDLESEKGKTKYSGRGQEFINITTVRELYQYLLIDVEMSDAVDTSLVRQAMTTMLTYFERLSLNIEIGGQLNSLKKSVFEKQWYWMHAYRLWQANRQVFLYPENYIRPELRKSKTELFQSFENHIDQLEASKESAEEAFKYYLNGFFNLGKLNIAGSCIYKHPKNRRDIIFVLFGYSEQQPNAYYYRTARFILDLASNTEIVTWDSWKEIKINIPATRVFPIYAYERIFLFWGQEIDKGENEIEVKLQYSFLDAENQWIQPQRIRRQDNGEYTFGDSFSNKITINLELDESEIRVLYGIEGESSVKSLTLSRDLTISDPGVSIPLQQTDSEYGGNIKRADNLVDRNSHLQVVSSIKWQTFKRRGSYFLIRPRIDDDEKFYLIRLDTNSVSALSSYLSRYGVPGVLLSSMQKIAELPTLNQVVSEDGKTSVQFLCSDDENRLGGDHLDFKGAYGLYYWEIFFHVPFYIADFLRNNQKFEEARDWYQYIFNPGESKENIWSFLPFKEKHLTLFDSMKEKTGQVSRLVSTLKNSPSSWQALSVGEATKNGIKFDGHHYLNCGLLLGPVISTGLTFELQVFIESSARNNTMVLIQQGDVGIGGSDVVGSQGIIVFIKDSEVKAYLQPKGHGFLSKKISLSDNMWNTIVLTWNQEEKVLKLYLNNTKAEAGNSASYDGILELPSIDNLYIGADANKGNIFKGYIKQVRVWNESSDYKNSTVVLPSSGLVGDWRLTDDNDNLPENSVVRKSGNVSPEYISLRKINSLRYHNDYFGTFDSSSGLPTAINIHVSHRASLFDNGYVRSMSVSRNNDWLAIAVDKKVKVFSLPLKRNEDDSGFLFDSLGLHGDMGTVTDVAFNHDEERPSLAVVGIGDGESTQQYRFQIFKKEANSDNFAEDYERDIANPVYSVAFSHDGKYVFLGDKSRVLGYRYSSSTSTYTFADADRRNNEHLYTIASHPKRNDRFVGGYRNHEIALERIASDGLHAIRDYSTHADVVKSVAFSPDGRWLLTGGNDDKVKVWKVNNDELDYKRNLFSLSENVEAIAFNSDEDRKWFAVNTALNRVTVYEWSVDDGAFEATELISLALESSVESLVFGADGLLFIGTKAGVTVRKVNTSDYRARDSWNTAAFGHDGRSLATGGSDEFVRLWEWQAGASTIQLKEVLKQDSAVNTVAFSADNRWFAIGTEGSVKLWRRNIEGMLFNSQNVSLDYRLKRITQIIFSLDSRYLIVVGRGNSDRIDSSSPVRFQVFELDLETGSRSLYEAKFYRPIYSVAVSPDGQFLVLGDAKRLILCISDNAKGFKHYYGSNQILITDHIAYSIAFHPTSGNTMYFVVGFSNNKIEIYKLVKNTSISSSTIHFLKDVEGNQHSNSVNSVAFSSDGKWFVSGGSDKKVKLWQWKVNSASPDLEFAKELGEHSDVVKSVAFNSDGQKIVSSGRTTMVWAMERKAFFDADKQILSNLALPPVLVNYKTALLKYKSDPYSPHAIAALRPLAYKKAFMMQYIDNLLDWGDNLFRRDTRNGVMEAQMLYMRAYNLLGPTPINLGDAPISDPRTVTQIVDKRILVDDFIELENVLSNDDKITEFEVPYNYIPGLYFSLPENHLFTRYWDKVQDRLYKIRHSLNIEGIKRSLALFAPPIDPMALVRGQYGGDIAGLLNPLSISTPHYRFDHLMERARIFTERVIQLGDTLRDALEKQDAEELAVLQQTHSRNILDLTQQIKENDINQAIVNIEALESSKRIAEFQFEHYERLLNVGLLKFEREQRGLMIGAQIASIATQVAKVVAAIAGGQETIAAGVNSGTVFKPEAFPEAIAETFSGISYGLILGSSLTGMNASFARRKEEWSLQRETADLSRQEIAIHIEAAKYQQKNAERELEILHKNIDQEAEVEGFLRNKFSNEALYQWMSKKIIKLYTDSFQMANHLALQAQKAMQYELALEESEVNYIKGGHWDNLHKGLLAAESLMTDLERLEKGYMEKNTRVLEISKTISLLQLNPRALIDLQNKGYCDFEFTEALFDLDFPGHYARQIQTISLSFPAVIGPYQNFNATLMQLNNKTVLKPDLSAVGFLLSGRGSAGDLIREDWRVNEQVALSRGVNDSGLFQVNFQDERYLPFEGTGAISSWRLTLSPYKRINIESLTDVIINLEYIALPGSDTFKQQVSEELTSVYADCPQARLFLLANEFSDNWHQLLESKKTTVHLHKNMLSRLETYTLQSLFVQLSYVNQGDSSFEVKVTIGKNQESSGEDELVSNQTNLTFKSQDAPELQEIPNLANHLSGYNDEYSITFEILGGNRVDFTEQEVRNIAFILTYKGRLESWTQEF